MANLFAFEANKVEAIDALVDFFPVEHPAFEFFNAYAEKFFVVFLDFASARFVTWKIFILRFVVAGFIEISL